LGLQTFDTPPVLQFVRRRAAPPGWLDRRQHRRIARLRASLGL